MKTPRLLLILPLAISAFAAVGPITSESDRTAALATAFPGMKIALVPGKTIDNTLRKTDKKQALVFPDAFASEKVYQVSGAPMNDTEKCAAGKTATVRELRLQLFPWPGAKADSGQIAVLQYRFPDAAPAASCQSIAILLHLTPGQPGWEVSERFPLDTTQHQRITGIQFVDLTGDGIEELVVDSDAGGQNELSTEAHLFDLSQGRFDEVLEMASRMYATAMGEEQYTQTIDVPRSLQQKGKQFCFAKTLYAEEGKWFPAPRVSHPCYDRGRSVDAAELKQRLQSATPAGFPQADISNGQIRATLYLPDPEHGYYRANRFDWSGVIAKLEYRDHNFFGPWFAKHDPKVNDAISGPVEEFRTGESALGYEDAKVGETFIRIGVGRLRKPEEPRFGQFKTYEIVDTGKWTVTSAPDRVTFTQELSDPAGYAYIYQKTVRLEKGKPTLVLEHTLKNTGRKVIETNVYDHNFLVIDGQPTGPDFSVRFPFDIHALREQKDLADFSGKRITYLKPLETGQSVYSEVQGFGAGAQDYDIHVENTRVGAGVHITGDQPLSKVFFWSIRTTLCAEPYIEMRIEPGQQKTWRIDYDFYTMP